MLGQRGQQGDADGQEHRPDHRIALVAAGAGNLPADEDAGRHQAERLRDEQQPRERRGNPGDELEEQWQEGHRPDEGRHDEKPGGVHDPEYRVAPELER